MNPNYPGGDPSHPGNPGNPGNPDPNSPTNPSGYPQQPYPQQPYPEQPQPAYGQQPGYPQQPPPYQPPVYNQTPPPPMPAGQPSYPQQPYPQQPYPQQPPKKSNKGWIIGCGIAAVLLLLICGGVGVALYVGAQRAGSAIQSTGQAALAATEVSIFCTDFETQAYGSAYQILSTSAQGRISQSDFTTRAAALDTSDGTIATCTIDPNHALPSVSSDGKSATAQVQVARGSNSNLATGTITLVYEDNQWKVDSADSSLKLF